MRYLFVFLLIGSMVSCGESTQDKKLITPKKTKNEKKTEIIIQPSCDKLGGMDDCQILGQFLEYDYYTGIIKCCENGKVMDFITLKDGLENGLSRGWYANGQIEYEANYKEGAEDGLYREWSEDGQLLSEGNYKDGLEDGLFREWHENGQLWYIENYKDGVEDGLYREWSEDGQLLSEGYYKDGVQDGLCREWSENGQIEYETNYKDGIGEIKCYDDDGNEVKCAEGCLH